MGERLKHSRPARIDSFDLAAGRIIGGRYVVNELLGAGWEGEVYSVVERGTGISRAAKVFFPHRNMRDHTVRAYAKKLDRLRGCPIIIQYHHSEEFRYRGQPITVLISELVEGELLEDFVRCQRNRRLQPFEALHLLHAITEGVEQIHNLGEYHGDLHDRNVLVRRRGIGFGVKLLDFYRRSGPRRQKCEQDILDLVRLLYDAVGGRPRYASQPPEIKAICLGLRAHLESFDWSS